MRLTNARLDDIRNYTLEFLRSHQLYTQLHVDRQHAAYQAVLDTDVAANGMDVVMASLPSLVKDQLPKIGNLRIKLDKDQYKNFKQAYAETFGEEKAATLPELTPFRDYYAVTVDFPPGKVVFSVTANELRTPKAGDRALLLGWEKIVRAQERITQAEKRVIEAGDQMRQLAVESVNLDAFLKTVPNARVIIPASWLAPPVEAPKQTMLDPDTSARLRALILGEEV